MNDDDSLRPINIDEDEEVTDLEDLDTDDDILGDTKKKSKKVSEDEDLDELADEEDAILPEDSFDDVAPEDLW
jgi:hypothetical protein